MNVRRSLLLLCYVVFVVQCRTTIPEWLQECYQNGTAKGTVLPMNLRVFLDLIQKLERHAYTSMDMRTIVSSMLHRFRFDGIEYQENVSISEGVSPFSGTGSQRVKNEIIENVVPGDPQVLHTEVLTLEERCTLHRAISSTIWNNPLADEDKNCDAAPSEKITGTSITKVTKRCPIESGVLITPHGAVAAGALIAAITASLQPQNVAIKLLITEPELHQQGAGTIESSGFDYNEDVDFIVPRDQMLLGRSMGVQVAPPVDLDNVWAATIAGDVAELAVYQGPLSQPIKLGETGFWNNTMRPTVYYLRTNNPNETVHFDATRAEIIGDIDGLIIAKNLLTWVDNFHSLRLSQVLNMYYSFRGICFDRTVKACQRRRSYAQVAPRGILDEQAYAFAHILSHRNSVAHLTEGAQERMVGLAADAFTTYVENFIFVEASCHEEKPRPTLDIIIAFDGSWSVDSTADIISVLLEDSDVSRFGSKMGLLHGTTGEWLINVTSSPASIFHAVYNFTNITWPSRLNYTRVLEEVGIYLNHSWEENKKSFIIGNVGQVIVLLAPQSTLSEDEKLSSKSMLQEIKLRHPDVHFLYYGSKLSFETFLLTDEDHLIETSKTIKIDEINQHLMTVPRVIRPAPCNSNVTQGLRNQIESYISPQQSVIYRLHPHWRNNTKSITVMVHSLGYGSMKVCSWNQWNITGQKEGLNCQEIDGHNEITFNDTSKCTNGRTCPNMYFQIQNVTSLLRCSEMNCKLPDDVRFIISIKDMDCTSSAVIGFSSFGAIIISYIVLILQKYIHM